LPIEATNALASGLEVADEDEERARQRTLAKLAEHMLHRMEAGRLVAVKQRPDDERARLLSREAKQRGAGEHAVELVGRGREEALRQAIDDVEHALSPP